MKTGQPHKLNTISAYHRFWGLPQPEHPLISVINFDVITHPAADPPITLINQFYSIALKQNFNGKLHYGQQPYDPEPFGLAAADSSRLSVEHAGSQNHPAVRFFQLCGPRSPAPLGERRRHDDGDYAAHPLLVK